MNIKIEKTDAEWREELTPEQYAICRCSATEHAQWADEIGIHGYFIAYDKKANSRTSNEFFVYSPVPSDKAIPNLAFGGQAQDYRMFSIPYDLDDNRIDEIFKTLGAYDKTLWRIVRYQGGQNVDKSEGLTKIERGQGFWFNAIDKVDVKIGSGTTVDKAESPDFTLTLAKGYNQIGDPFTFDVSWADVLDKNQSLAPKLSQQLLIYNSTNWSLSGPEDASWLLEDDLRQNYLHLFDEVCV